MTTSNIHGKVVIDFDDILANTSEAVFNFMKANWLQFAPNLKPVSFDYDVNERPVRDIIRALARLDITEERLLGVLSTLFSRFYNNKAVYLAYLTMTDLYKSICSNTLLLNNNKIDKIYVAFRSLTEDDMKVKEEIFNELFQSEKFEMLKIGEHEYEQLKNMDWNLYITDNSNVITKLIEDKDYNIEGKEFLVLDRPYSRLDEVQEILIKEKGASINYYK